MRHRRTLISVLAVLVMPVFVGVAIANDSSYSANAAKKAKSHHKKHKTKKKHKAKKLANVSLTAGSVTLAFNQTVSASFQKQNVTLSPTAPAQVPGANTVTFPIASGTLNPGTGYGSVNLTGGFTFEGPTTNIVFFSSQSSVSLAAPITITLGAGSVSQLSANVGSPPQDAAFFTLKATKPTVQGKTLTISAIPTALNAPAASVMSQAFGSGAYQTGEEVATITIQAIS